MSIKLTIEVTECGDPDAPESMTFEYAVRDDLTKQSLGNALAYAIIAVDPLVNGTSIGIMQWMADVIRDQGLGEILQ